MSAAPDKLAALLETLPSAERQEIAAWLFAGAVRERPGLLFGPAQFDPVLFSMGTPPFPSGEDSQMATVRLPTESHDRLRTWCSEHGFTMTAVIRGLVERFLDEQAKTPPQP
jgi:hypothetical protein